ncbi:Cthe_2314 family HEPN domain-containing protein [Pedobacter sp. FW305-3-2-15-E-R2A2]|uniref:Cthe_2314 family HEPN domain-containing protein n=1 Tax=Pedobacter sp. FW305-3-2-15-E-R2A2 TaxID=3140251 RepID=UPI0031409037
MVNKEFNEMKSGDTPFIEALNAVFVKYSGYKNNQKYKEFTNTPFGNYISRVHNRVAEIIQNAEDMEMIRTLITEHDPGFSKLERETDSAKLIRYHYENFFIRIGKVKDLLLLLINDVLLLDLKKGLSMENQLLKILPSQYPYFPAVWNQVKGQLDKLKPYRNHLAHNGTIQFEDLTLLDIYYKYDFKHKNHLEQYKYSFAMGDIQRKMVDKITNIIKVYIQNVDQIVKLIYTFLTQPLINSLKKFTSRT